MVNFSNLKLNFFNYWLDEWGKIDFVNDEYRHKHKVADFLHCRTYEIPKDIIVFQNELRLRFHLLDMIVFQVHVI